MLSGEKCHSNTQPCPGNQSTGFAMPLSEPDSRADMWAKLTEKAEDLVQIHTAISDELVQLGKAVQDPLDASSLHFHGTGKFKAEMVRRQERYAMYLAWLGSSEQIDGEDHPSGSSSREPNPLVEIKDQSGKGEGLGVVMEDKDKVDKGEVDESCPPPPA
jgi:hypothetical protein